jgi:hypothetical protein
VNTVRKVVVFLGAACLFSFSAPSGGAQTQSPSTAPAAAQPPQGCPAPEHRQFDFWVGEWDVYVKGQQIATSSIQNILGGCVIFENWNPLRGGPGKSFNYYDPHMKRWRQVWVASSPGSHEYVGDLRGGNMVFEGKGHQRDGTSTLYKMTFFNLGTDKVRQYIEQSTDGGKTWSTYFDGEYRRKK